LFKRATILLLFIYLYMLFFCDIYCYTTFRPCDNHVFYCNQSCNGNASTREDLQQNYFQLLTTDYLSYDCLLSTNLIILSMSNRFSSQTAISAYYFKSCTNTHVFIVHVNIIHFKSVHTTTVVHVILYIFSLDMMFSNIP
jgi:hypothetical protein